MRARRPLLLLVLLALPLSGCMGAPNSANEGEPPSWSFVDTDGATHDEDDPPGNATVLFFMATWCTSCRAKAPVLAEAHQAHAAQGVRFYTIGYDPTESLADLGAWKQRYQQPWPHGLDADRSMQRTFGVTTQSSVVVLDGDGRVVESWGYGRVTTDALRAALERALAAPA